MDYKLRVAAVCDHGYAVTGKVQAVTAVLEHHGYDYALVVDPLWRGFISKVWAQMDAVRDLPDSYTHIALIDAADVVFLAGPDEIMERWFTFKHPWVMNTEPAIWTPGSHQPEDYPTPDVLYRYLNSGASIGEVGHIRHWFDRWGRPKSLSMGDQDWFANRFLEDYPDAIKLDTNCDLFQCMCGSLVQPDPHCIMTQGEVYNRITNTRPLIIHFNGGDDITKPNRRYLWEHFLQKPLPG